MRVIALERQRTSKGDEGKEMKLVDKCLVKFLMPSFWADLIV
jgi:hypothetical protein